ncbi:radical SAM protein [Salmonella enterica subsp. enterica serovar Braenderup]|nr:radical SAM protein [Salmonella enterica subsp. enterica serovar Braenderup]
MTTNAEPRLSNRLYDKPTVLSVVATSKCNLDCSFCGGAYYMNREDSPREFQRERILEALEANPTITEIQWTGGEPLLATRKIEAFVDELKVIRPELKHQLYTNGLKMRKSHLPLLKQFDNVYVSIDGFKSSERPFMRFIDEGCYEALETIYELENVQTWGVLTRDRLGDKRWHEDIIQLHSAIYHYGFRAMTLLLDAKMPKPLSPDHVMNFIYGYYQVQDNIERLNVVNGRECGFTVSKVFEEGCNVCSESLWINADGGEHQLQNAPNVLESGCNQLAFSIGVEAYEYIRRVVMAGRNRGAANESSK